MSLELWLVRHGESEANANPYFKTVYMGCNNWSNLTEKGKEQSRLLGEHLKREGIEFEKVYSSVAVRAQQTARYCLEAMDIPPLYTLSMDLREIDQGSLEGKPKSNNKPQGVDWWTYVPEGGFECQEMVYRRASDFIYREIISKYAPVHETDGPSKRFLLFTHENVISCFRVGILGLDPKDAWKSGIVNTGINIMSYDPSDMSWAEIHKCYAPHLSLEDSVK